MSQTPSLPGISEDLLCAARRAAQVRTIPEQIEYWARLGQAIEPFLDRACAAAEKLGAPAAPAALSACLQSASTEVGQKRLAEHLARLPFPHYEPDGELPDGVLRIEADGTRFRGRFVNGVFQSAD